MLWQIAVLLLALSWHLVHAAVDSDCSTSGAPCVATTETCSVNQCTCAAGYEVQNDNTCTACGTGYYKNSIGHSDSCIQAPRGKFTVDNDDSPVTTAATNVKQADVGYYASNETGEAVSVNATKQMMVTKGSFACSSTDTTSTYEGVNIGADKECACPTGYMTKSNGLTACDYARLGYYTVDISNAATSTEAVDEEIVPACRLTDFF